MSFLAAILNWNFRLQIAEVPTADTAFRVYSCIGSLTSVAGKRTALQYLTDPDIMHEIGRDDFLDQ